MAPVCDAFLSRIIQEMRFRLGLCLGPHWENLKRSPDLVAGLRGPSSKGRGWKPTSKRDGKGRAELTTCRVHLRVGSGLRNRENQWVVSGHVVVNLKICTFSYLTLKESLLLLILPT